MPAYRREVIIMNIPTLIAGAVVIAAPILAIIYIVKAKKKGAKCIGCPVSGSCQEQKDHDNNCCCG